MVDHVVWDSVSRHIRNGHLYGSVLEGDWDFMSAVDPDLGISPHSVDQLAPFGVGGIPHSAHWKGAKTEIWKKK